MNAALDAGIGIPAVGIALGVAILFGVLCASGLLVRRGGGTRDTLAALGWVILVASPIVGTVLGTSIQHRADITAEEAPIR